MNRTLPTIIIIVLIALGAGYFIMKRNSAPVTVAPQTGTGSEQPVQVSGQGTGATETPAGASGSSGKENTSPSASKKTFTVEGSSFKFSPDKIEVKKGDTVEITFKNTDSSFPHNIAIDALNVKSKTIGAGESDTFTFVADKAGTFEFYCAVPTHRDRGMVGTLTVTE